MIIFLIGFMGSGKSFQANKLAEKLDFPKYDLDEYIEIKENNSILSIFENHGETLFRDLEKRALRELVEEIQQSGKNAAIISCGGGTPCFHGNMDYMNQNGVTIWLNTPVPVLVERLISESQNRPLVKSLTVEELPVFISDKLREREPYYKKANIIIHDPDIDSETLINLIQHATKLS